MYTTCPKCGHERGEHESSDTTSCPACGLIFAKWMKQQFTAPETTLVIKEHTEDEDGLLTRLSATVLYVDDKTDPVYFYGRAALYIILVIMGWRFIQMEFETNAIGHSFLHTINLVFHEAGHIIFSPFGYFMTKLGGTLGQLLMPLIVTIAFLFRHRNTFAASVGLWWLAQSIMDCAPYINDALHQDMVLLGGVTGQDRPGYHDWNSILGELDMIEKHHEVATMFDNIGVAVMLLSLLWGGFILYRQYQNL